MKFKLDENVPNILKETLNSHGFEDVESVPDEKLKGVSDHKLLKICLKEERILITLDMDFSRPVLHPLKNLYTIIILQLKIRSKYKIKELFEAFISKFSIQDTKNKVLIVGPSLIRIRDE